MVRDFCSHNHVSFLPFNTTFFFLAGIHTFCTPDCASYDKDAPDIEERRPTRAEQEDILDIPELEEGVSQSKGGAVSAGEDGDRRQEDRPGSDNALPSPPPAGSTDVADTGAGKGGATPAQKKTVKPCVGSKFTVASLLQSLDDSIRLAITKSNLWARTLVALTKVRETRVDLSGGESSEQEESLLALEAAVQHAQEAANKVSEAALAFQQKLETNAANVHGVSDIFYVGAPFAVQGFIRQ